jgi:hypothetical protein
LAPDLSGKPAEKIEFILKSDTHNKKPAIHQVKI